MFLRRSIAAMIVVAACVALWARADDKSKTPSTPAEKPKTVRLVKPWSEISSLSDEQKDKIHDIHAKALADVKAINQKQHDDIVALLNDDQKKELQKIENASKAGNKPKQGDATAGTEEKKD